MDIYTNVTIELTREEAEQLRFELGALPANDDAPLTYELYDTLATELDREDD